MGGMQSAHSPRRAWGRIKPSGARGLFYAATVGACLMLAFASTARAATGDLLASITAANPEACGVNVGIAFDGQHLLVSCISGTGQGSTHIDYINPSNGSLFKSLTVNLPGVAAMAYDAGRGKLWACDSPTGGNSPGSGTEVYLIDPTTGVATDQFRTAGCWDGLAYDGADDTLWVSPDQSDIIYHYASSGTFIKSFSGLRAGLAGFGNSGIAVGGAALYLSNADGGTIYTAPKDFSTPPSPAATEPGQHIEDMECDSVTFAPKDAMWVISAFDRTVNAYEIPANSCGVGGQSTRTASPPAVLTSVPSVGANNRASFSGSVTPDGLPTSAHFEYGLDKRYFTAGASRPAYTHTTPPQNAGSDFSSHVVTAAVTGLVPNAIYHVRLVASNSAGTTFGPDVTFTTKRVLAPPPPALGKTFNISPVAGVVLIKLNGQLVPLTQLRQVRTDTVIDALHGTLQLITAAGGHPASGAAAKGKQHKGKVKTQTGRFSGAIFTIPQAHSGLATLSLAEGAVKGGPNFAKCKARKTADATASALSSKTLQLLHASAKGKFRTKGRYSAATVRGTKWTIADRCDGTLTHDITDSVVVSDIVRHKTIVLHAGQSYLAKKP